MLAWQWTKVEAGIWKGTVGVTETVTPLSAAAVQPKRDALERMGDAAMPLFPEAIEAYVSPEGTVIQMPLQETERIYGFGLQFMRTNHRGRTRHLRVNSDPKEDTGETHAPLPFWVTSEGYAILIDSARPLTVYAGSAVRVDSKRPPAAKNRVDDADWMATPLSDTLEVLIPYEQGATVYLFAGSASGERSESSLLDAVRRYILFSGGGVLPPRWGLGFWHRVSIHANAEETLREARQFRERNIPCDVIGLEPGWHSHAYPVSYEWSEERFPDPEAFVRSMAEEGFRINLWEHPYVSPEAPIYEELLPYAGTHSVWCGIAPDYTLPEAAAILERQHAQRHVNIGVSGYKIDEVDGSELTGNSWMFPAQARFPSGLDGGRMRQIYGLLMQNITERAFKKKNVRTLGLVRATNAGGASKPYVLYSDLYGHREYVRALCNSGFSGLLWTPELREADTAEEFIRRLQTTCCSPLAMLNGWASGTAPWSFPEYESIVRSTIELRMRLMPYLYSAFAAYREEGIPPFRAMALEMGRPCEKQPTDQDLGQFDSSSAPYGLYGEDFSIDDQYMMGESILVAPLFAGETSRDVYLPPGDWFEFHTGVRHRGGQFIAYAAGLDEIPLFVKDGGIIPLMPVRPSAPRPGEKVPLEVRCYGSKQCVFRLYDDDGETTAHEAGHCRWIDLHADGTSVMHAELSQRADDRAFTYGEMKWTYMQSNG
ncbi:TIM-barrel domain-containing protein [Paenibacillus sacheonensis]|nr:TIM-barrel domain-containing protein [Paenibacillus sacheonensis]MBM7567829.1 alpha-D-xyloside xylohydrolase [Paenibacillus sacheonensis]